jgi:AcrR family transcriptional regulator
MSSPDMQARRPNPRGSGQRLREDIVSAARDMLIENGYESAVTLRAVARRVGIAPQSIYHHFASPEEIVQAVTVETFGELGRYIAAAKQGVDVPRDRLLTGCRAYIAFGIGNPHLYDLLFRRNRLLRGQEAAPEEGRADTRDPEAGPFAAMMKDIRACIADGSSEATSVLQTAVQLWAGMHGLVLLRGGGYQFPWPDLNQTEMELISSLARFRDHQDSEPAGRDLLPVTEAGE